MNPSRLLEFLKTGRRLNAFERARSLSGGDDAEYEVKLREILKATYLPRTEFEEAAGGGLHFHYGTLNAGGMGAPSYGAFCVVYANAPRADDIDPVWIVDDSLASERFWDESGTLQWDDLARWIAPPDMAAELAALKFAEEPEISDGLSWTERLCNDDEYIESVSVESPTPETIGEIRSETDHNVQDRALDALLSGSSMDEDLEFTLQERIRRAADHHGIEWILVE